MEREGGIQQQQQQQKYSSTPASAKPWAYFFCVLVLGVVVVKATV
jgi:hypothetical protein